MTRRTTTISLCVAAAIAAASTASATASAPPFDFALKLSTPTPATTSGLTFETRYSDPSDPSAKPVPLRKSVIQAPAGTIFNGHAVPACTASDNDLMLMGSAACPPQSQVGTGQVIVITGCGAPADPLTLNVLLFNSGNGIIELFSEDRTGARITVGHATFTAPNTITETPASNPGCPPSGETSVRQVDFHFNDVRGANATGFITSPRRCPPSGTWTSTASATLADGHTYTAASTTPCTPPRRRPARHRTRTHHHAHRHRTSDSDDDHLRTRP